MATFWPVKVHFMGLAVQVLTGLPDFSGTLQARKIMFKDREEKLEAATPVAE
jgi:hypothetical protein